MSENFTSVLPKLIDGMLNGDAVQIDFLDGAFQFIRFPLNGIVTL